MFEELRKKISGAIKGVIRKEEAEQAKESHLKEELPQRMQEQKREEAAAKEPEKREKREDSKEEISERQEEEQIKENAESAKQSAEPALSVHEGTEQHKDRKEPKKENAKLLKVSIASRIKGAFSSGITLSDKEVADFVDKVKISFLEADVSYDVADALSESLRESLKGMKVSPSSANVEFVEKVRESMLSLLSNGKKGVDLLEFIHAKIKEESIPVKILFLGPNGTGKTTTIAKIAYMLKQNRISALISASDTFRAAAIEQTEYHANKVGVPVVKSKYGADPASVAFDAIAHAKAQGIEVVLIDSAGRQETNKNLISEIQKLVRVTKPDITIFVAESTAGSALAGQIKEFNNVAKIDGIILTKLDCDAKGGNALSIAKETGIPILFLGTGESYDSIVKFDPSFIVDSILPRAS